MEHAEVEGEQDRDDAEKEEPGANRLAEEFGTEKRQDEVHRTLQVLSRPSAQEQMKDPTSQAAARLPEGPGSGLIKR